MDQLGAPSNGAENPGIDPSQQQGIQPIGAGPAVLQQQQQQVGAPPAQQAMHPALAAINPAMQQAAMYQFPRPPTATGGVAPVPQPFYFPPGMQQQFTSASVGTTTLPPPPPRPRSKVRAGSAATNRKQCNCKNSRCLKLYCECFASGRYCDGCNCNNCCNNRTNEDKRQSAIESILDRNPNAFRPKIEDEADDIGAPVALPNARHNKGCNCKKSGCLKKYCECFQAGIVCSENCKCVDCKNFEGSTARAIIFAHEAKVKANNYQTGGGSVPGMRSLSNLGNMPPGMIYPKPEPGSSLPTGAPSSAGAALAPQGMNQTQRQLAAKDALRDVVSPEVVDKMSMLLMILANEEADRRATAGETDDSEELPAPTEDGVARRKTLYEEQERLVLTEFRDTLRTITRVVADKVQKKINAVTAKQQAFAAAIATQQAQAHAHALQQAHAAAAQMAVAAAGTSGGAGSSSNQMQMPQAYRGGPVPPGMQPVYLMQGGRPQLVLVPQQALMAQQLAQQQQLAAVQQQAAAAAAAAAQQHYQQQQQLQQQQPQAPPAHQGGDTQMTEPDGNAGS